MATKDKKRAFTDSDTWKGFVRCDLDAAAREALSQWIEDAHISDILTWFCLLPMHGFKASITWDSKSDSFMASMTGIDVADPVTYGWCLTARARDCERSIAALQYKHLVLMGEDWSDHRAMRDDQPDNKWFR